MSSLRFTPGLDAIVKRVDSLPVSALILIDGASGTGKTTLAELIAKRTAHRDAITLIHMDDLYRGWSGLDEGIAHLNEWILRPRATGRTIKSNRFDWATGEFVEGPHIDPAQTMIVEGCGALGGGAHEFADLTLWLAADDETRRKRAIARNPREALAEHWSMWEEQFVTYLKRESPATRASMHVRADG